MKLKLLKISQKFVEVEEKVNNVKGFVFKVSLSLLDYN